MSVPWPSDSIFQRTVGPPQRGDGHAVSNRKSDKSFSGDDLADDMSRLNIPSLPSSPPTARRRRIDMDRATALHYPVLVLYPKYRYSNSMPGTVWDTVGISPAPVPAFTAKGAPFGSGRTAKYWNIQENCNEDELSSDPLNAIFSNITSKKGSKRFAQLRMSNSGRWRIARYPCPSGVSPSAARSYMDACLMCSE